MTKKLLKSSSIFVLMTLISRILGFIRDIVAASLFGTGPGYDAFVLSFRIPNLMRRLFAEGAFLQAFIPVLSEYRLKETHKDVRQFVSYVTGNLGLILLIVSVFGVLETPFIIKVFAPGFSKGDVRIHIASEMLRITFPYIMFISLTALASGILNIYGRFAATAFSPVFLNISIISASLYLSEHCTIPEKSLAWGVALAGILQLGFMLFFVKQERLLVCPKINWHDPGVRQVLTLMLPAVFGAAVSQINFFIDTLFASFLSNGSFSWLYYSDRLMEFPLGVFGIGIATVMLPQLSSQYSTHSEAAFSATLDWGIRNVLLIGVPSAIGMYVLAGPLLATLFQSGRFLPKDVWMSTKSLMAYALAVIGIMLVKILSTAFYARRDIRTPVQISVCTGIINILLNTFLIVPLAHVGLAISTSVTVLCNAIMLWLVLVRRGLYKRKSGWQTFMVRLGIANGTLYTIMALIVPDLELWISWPSKTRIYCLLPLIGFGVVIYIGILLIVGLRPKDLIILTYKNS